MTNEVAVRQPQGIKKVDRLNEEFTVYLKLSEEFAKSNMFPNAKTPAAAFSIIQYGKELGIPPVTSLQNIYIVNGKLGVSTQLFASKVESEGVETRIIEETGSKCSIEFTRGNKKYISTFTMEDAKTAELIGKDNWRHHPKDMLYWSAYRKGARKVAPNATMNLYTPDELENLEPEELKGKPVVDMPEAIEVEAQEQTDTATEPTTPEEPKPEKSKAKEAFNRQYGEVHSGNARKDLQVELLNYVEGNIEKAKKLLLELTTWTNDKGDVVEGVDTFTALTEKQSGVTLSKLRELKKKNLEAAGASIE